MSSDQTDIVRTELPSTANFQVDARRVFRESVKDVDAAVDELLPTTRIALAALVHQFDGENGAFAAKSVLECYSKLNEIRARLKGEHQKLLVEMQKDLNKCIIERKRIDAQSPPVDLKNLSDEQLSSLLAVAS